MCPKNRITQAVVVILLVLSVISAIHLSSRQRQERKKFPFKIGDISAKPSIGVINIYGAIHSTYEEKGFIPRGGPTGILESLKKFRKDKKIKAVILRINSPGGTIGAVQEITQEIYRLRKSGKPVVASISDMAASGGYYVATACDKIVSNNGSIIGSIGVIFMSPDMSGLLEKIGVRMETIKSGPYKDVGSPYRAHTEDEKKFLQSVVDDAFNQFVVQVSSGRGFPLSTVKKYAKGQIYTGRMALKLGLIDKIGDMTVAKELAENLAGIEDAKLIRQPRIKWMRIFEFLNKSNLLNDIVGTEKFSGLAYIYKP